MNFISNASEKWAKDTNNAYGTIVYKIDNKANNTVDHLQIPMIVTSDINDDGTLNGRPPADNAKILYYWGGPILRDVSNNLNLNYKKFNITNVIPFYKQPWSKRSEASSDVENIPTNTLMSIYTIVDTKKTGSDSREVFIHFGTDDDSEIQIAARNRSGKDYIEFGASQGSFDSNKAFIITKKYAHVYLFQYKARLCLEVWQSDEETIKSTDISDDNWRSNYLGRKDLVIGDKTIYSFQNNGYNYSDVQLWVGGSSVFPARKAYIVEAKDSYYLST